MEMKIIEMLFNKENIFTMLFIIGFILVICRAIPRIAKKGLEIVDKHFEAINKIVSTFESSVKEIIAQSETRHKSHDEKLKGIEMAINKKS